MENETPENSTEQKELTAYEKAQNRGKNILYICALGKSRSPRAVQYALDRDETNSSALDGGAIGIFKTGKTTAEIDEQLKELCDKNVLRVFTDNGEQSQLINKLEELVSRGEIEQDDFEKIDMTKVMKEMKAANQDISTLLREMLTD